MSMLRAAIAVSLLALALPAAAADCEVLRKRSHDADVAEERAAHEYKVAPAGQRESAGKRWDAARKAQVEAAAKQDAAGCPRIWRPPHGKPTEPLPTTTRPG